jgi:hypothetical protein
MLLLRPANLARCAAPLLFTQTLKLARSVESRLDSVLRAQAGLLSISRRVIQSQLRNFVSKVLHQERAGE